MYTTVLIFGTLHCRQTAVFTETTAGMAVIVRENTDVVQLRQCSLRNRLSDSDKKHVHVKGQINFRWVVLLVAKICVAVGTIYSRTMLCLHPAHGAASLYRG